MMDFPRPEVFGNYMLKNFGDIVMPEDLPWWPIQPGWWVLLAVIVTLISTYAYRRYRHWQRNAYRRRALTELAAMATLRDMNSIVKRATESAFPSDSTETLWGGAWIDYLNHKTDTPCFINGDDKLFNCLLTQPQGNWPEGIEALRGRVRAWLELHREETL